MMKKNDYNRKNDNPIGKSRAEQRLLPPLADQWGCVWGLFWGSFLGRRFPL
jgi:hypothetical protein